jgi:hypothetical protein
VVLKMLNRFLNEPLFRRDPNNPEDVRQICEIIVSKVTWSSGVAAVNNLRSSALKSTPLLDDQELLGKALPVIFSSDVYFPLPSP